MRFEILLLLSLTICAASAQQQHHETVVVTGAFEPMSLEEIDLALRVLPARENGLVLNTLADLLRLDPSLDLQGARAGRRAGGPFHPRR